MAIRPRTVVGGSVGQLPTGVTVWHMPAATGGAWDVAARFTPEGPATFLIGGGDAERCAAPVPEDRFAWDLRVCMRSAPPLFTLLHISVARR